MAALKHYYRDLGTDVVGHPRSGGRVQPMPRLGAPIYMGLNQAPIVTMIENYQSGLVWKSPTRSPEIGVMLKKLEVTHPE
jgi:exo beta-1,2-glucooligosaccharide sophorohydrolase (non-reducing end)